MGKNERALKKFLGQSTKKTRTQKCQKGGFWPKPCPKVLEKRAKKNTFFKVLIHVKTRKKKGISPESFSDI